MALPSAYCGKKDLRDFTYPSPHRCPHQLLVRSYHEQEIIILRRNDILPAAIVAIPIYVQAEDDPPPTPQPVKPPWITGKNPQVSISTTELTDLNPAGIVAYSPGLEVPLLSTPPEYVDLVPQESVDPAMKMDPLAVPQRYQDPLDQTCGAAALGMALEFLSFNGEGSAPSQAALVSG